MRTGTQPRICSTACSASGDARDHHSRTVHLSHRLAPSGIHL